MSVELKVVNWMEVMGDIKEHLTYREIAEETACGISTLHAIANGDTIEPLYSLGDLLLQIREREAPIRKVRKPRK